MKRYGKALYVCMFVAMIMSVAITALFIGCINSIAKAVDADAIVARAVDETEYISPTPDTTGVEEAQAQVEVPEQKQTVEKPKISSAYFKYHGVVNYKSAKYTYYSSKVLHHKDTYKWHTVDGYYYDDEGYLVMASSDYKLGTVINDTPFGPAKIYDAGCPTHVFDVYVSW